MKALLISMVLMASSAIYANVVWQGVSVADAGWQFWACMAAATSPLWFGLPCFVREMTR